MESIFVKVARKIAEGLGDNLDHAFVNKGEWNRCHGEKGGRYRDINEPMLDDYLTAAHEALAVVQSEKIDGLECDLYSAVQVAWRRGAREWARLNYPDWIAQLEADDAPVSNEAR